MVFSTIIYDVVGLHLKNGHTLPNAYILLTIKRLNELLGTY